MILNFILYKIRIILFKNKFIKLIITEKYE